jgi:hypothetical protein
MLRAGLSVFIRVHPWLLFHVPRPACIHPSNPSSGAYGGMSIAIFPVDDAPCLLSFVVGTQGLSPDEEILGRPGHARKVQAICAWLNRKYGRGKLVAWAKEDPVRTDQDLPANLAKQFPAYRSVFDRYGKVLYAIFVPTEEEATRDAVTAFLDLMFDERGQRPLAAAQEESEQIQAARWQVAADQLLAAGDVGLVPWVPLTQFTGPPAPILKECRRRIDEQALPDERANLLAVSQVLVQLRYNDPDLLAILGGERAMIESPLIKEIVAENTQKARQEAIVEFLHARFGAVPDAITEAISTVRAERKLKALIKHAAQCPDLEAFRRRLLS